MSQDCTSTTLLLSAHPVTLCLIKRAMRVLPSVCEVSLPYFGFLLLWCFFTRKDRGILSASSQEFSSCCGWCCPWCAGGGRLTEAAVSGGVRGTVLELQYAVGLAQSPADWRRWGVSQGVARGNFHIHQCRTNYNKRTSAGGGLCVSISVPQHNRCMNGDTYSLQRHRSTSSCITLLELGSFLH